MFALPGRDGESNIRLREELVERCAAVHQALVVLQLGIEVRKAARQVELMTGRPVPASVLTAAGRAALAAR